MLMCTQESQEGHIDLPVDDHAIVKLLMQYLYEGEYDPILSLDSDFQVQATSIKAKKSKSTAKTPTSIFPHDCQRNSWNQCHEPLLCAHHTCGINCTVNCNNFSCNECVGPADQLHIHVQMYEIGDKYDVVGLKALSTRKFHRDCQYFWGDSAFPIAAGYALSTTTEEDKGLRNIVGKTIS